MPPKFVDITRLQSQLEAAGAASLADRIVADKRINRFCSLADRMPGVVAKHPTTRPAVMGVLSQLLDRPEAAKKARRAILTITRMGDQTELGL